MRDRDVALYGRPLACKDCGGSLGTLVKTGENEYKHQDSKACKIQKLCGKRTETSKHKEKLTVVRKPAITAGVRAKRTKSWPRTGTKRTESGLILPQ